MASAAQGRMAQNLALVCNFCPPVGFTRISEWTLGLASSEYDEHPDKFKGSDFLTFHSFIGL